MSCTNCFNGCAEIVSDQCVKYTGIDVPALGIHNGDTLATVENAIISFIEPFIDGSGIKPVIDPDIICKLVKQYLPTCTECNGFNLNDVLSAIIKAACDLQEQIDNITAELALLNAPYDVGCLPTEPTSDTHTVLQFVINKLCQVEIDLAALALDLSTNYVAISDINDYIAAYLTSVETGLVKNKMVPYSIIAYNGPIDVFDGTGKGTGIWDKIYICNGQHGTYDLRGRTIVGCTNVPGSTMSNVVNPSIPGNPDYVMGWSTGANSIILTTPQLPPHIHPNTVNTILEQTPHAHGLTGGVVKFSGPYGLNYAADFAFDAKYETDTALANISVSTTITNYPTGQGEAHSNIQPSISFVYITYIP